MSDSEGEVIKDTTKTETPKPEKVKKPLSEKQLAGLHKGMEALKAKRLQLQKEKEERETKKAKGEVVAEPVKIPKKEVKVLEPVVVVEPPAPKVRKERIDKGKKRGAIKPPTITRQEFEALQQKIVEALPKEKVVEKVVEKPVEKVIEKVVVTEKKVTGSEMLNKIFNLR
jgi:hypothetical protein